LWFVSKFGIALSISLYFSSKLSAVSGVKLKFITKLFIWFNAIKLKSLLKSVIFFNILLNPGPMFGDFVLFGGFILTWFKGR